MKKNSRRKFRFSSRKRKLFLFLVFVLFLGMGYSILGSSLAINGSVNLKKYVAPTLYNVLKTEAESNGLAKEYTGIHQDSMDVSLSNEKIYSWRSESSSNAAEIVNMYNVIFAGFCWQMVRTTDTGGVRLLYNGEAVNNQCLDSRGNHVGYNGLVSTNLNSNYWYGTSYSYNSGNNSFTLTGSKQQSIWNSSTSENLIGKYTCRNTSENGTCSTLYLVDSYASNTSANAIQINSSAHYSQIGTLPFNKSYSSPADVGYMNDARYDINEKPISKQQEFYGDSSVVYSFNVNYWYADDISWNPDTNNYKLVNPFQISSLSETSNLIGKYTLRSTVEEGEESSAHYIADFQLGSSRSYYSIILQNGKLINDIEGISYGDSYVKNNDGTYTIDNFNILKKQNWRESYSSFNNKYICLNESGTCEELRYIVDVRANDYGYLIVDNNIKYSNSFTYHDGVYELDAANLVTTWNITNAIGGGNNYSYTCWNETGICESVSYISFLFINGLDPKIDSFYFNLNNGKNIDNAFAEMLTVNTNNSIIKNGVDSWYKENLLSYSNYIEDTIYCNDRSIANSSMGIGELSGSSELSCNNVTDRFSVSNNSAKLIYPVGLISYRELDLINNYNAFSIYSTGNKYWTMSPAGFKSNGAYISSTGYRYYVRNYYASVMFIKTNGTYASNNYSTNSSTNGTNESNGVRPAISLKPGMEYSSGDGSKVNPYIVDTN